MGLYESYTALRIRPARRIIIFLFQRVCATAKK